MGLSLGNYDHPFGAGMPLSKETDTTYGGTKPGKAPTLKQPKAPDPFQLIEAQAAANRVNEKSPLGTLNYTKDPNTGRWTVERQFDPRLEQMFSRNIDIMGGPVDLPDVPSSSEFSEDALRQERATFDRITGLLNPELERQQREKETRLIQQGMPVGSEGYGGEMTRFETGRNEALLKAALDSVSSGRQEQSRLFDQSLRGGQTKLQQNLARRGQLFNEMQALLGGAQIGAIPQLDTLTPAQMSYQGQVNSVNAANQNAQARNQQTTSAAGAGLSALALLLCSKERKTDYREVNHEEILNGVKALPVEAWKYHGEEDTHLGPYAEDFQAIFGLGDGRSIPIVDAVGVCLSAIKALSNRVSQLEKTLEKGTVH